MEKRTRFQRFNDWVADKLSYLLSIMATFYIVSLLVFIPLFFTQPTSFVAWASYLCSVIFQGIALPILGYTSRKAGDKTDTVMREIYKMTEKIEQMTELIEKQQLHMEVDVDEILEFEKSKPQDSSLK